MCTVTYLPINSHDFLLTHNRDEKTSRGIALLPIKKQIHQKEIICPTDVDALGTWISLSNHFSCCILNGGFERHISIGPYKHSRGKIILDFFSFSSVNSFLREYDFYNIEPFTLIIVEHEDRIVHEIVLDNSEITYRIKDSTLPHLWSSSTLYDIASRSLRTYYFNLFTQTKNFTQENIVQFHTDGFKTHNDEGFIINRDNELKTVSVSSIYKHNVSSFSYIDLVNNQNQRIEL